ncbi:MAG: hypothetical protein Q9162_000795 [Coniocarpon cinnabarinum]
MRELDALVGSYVHLPDKPRANEALRELQKIASLVKPIMRNRRWRVQTLAEFFPEQTNLLGLNVNNGQQICIRLRYAGDHRQFLPLDSVVDTMLHELCHNVHGPHNAEFHKLWNELRDEYTDLKIKGYTGEGFLSDGQRLGGRRMPMHEQRRQRRAAAEKRNTLQKGSGQRLGGRPASRSVDVRNVITDAVKRRESITQGCGSGTRANDIRIANEVSRNGFRTQAEEDQANDRAIAEALWELAQQDAVNQEPHDPLQWKSEGLQWDRHNGLDVPAPLSSKHKRSHSDMTTHSTTWFEDDDEDSPQDKTITPTNVPHIVARLHPSDEPRPDSDTLGPEKPRVMQSPRLPSSPRPPANSSSKARPQVFLPEKHLIRKPPPIEEHPAFRNSRGSHSSSNQSSNHSAAPSVSSFTSSNPVNSPHPSAFMSPIEHNSRRHSVAAPTPIQAAANHSPSPPPLQVETTWTCPSCTLVNPTDYLCCDACTGPRPCLGTIDDFASLQDLGPDAIPTQSPNSPAELPGSAYFPENRYSAGSSDYGDRYSVSSRYSSRPGSTRTVSRLVAAQKTARSLDAATRNQIPSQAQRIGWSCACGNFMENCYWTCNVCGKMKTSS